MEIGKPVREFIVEEPKIPALPIPQEAPVREREVERVKEKEREPAGV